MSESADGLMDSRRCSETVISETLTGAETPTPGLISTRPSIRGSVADMPGYPTFAMYVSDPLCSPSLCDLTKKLLFGGPETRTKAAMPYACLVLSPHGRFAMCIRQPWYTAREMNGKLTETAHPRIVSMSKAYLASLVDCANVRGTA